MELISGNNEKEFQEWFNSQVKQVNIWGICQFNAYDLELFYALPFEMQKGVFKEYYKYLGYHFHTELGVNLRTSLIDGYNYFINQVKDNKKEFVYLGFSETEEEANKEILSKLDEIVNNN